MRKIHLLPPDRDDDIIQDIAMRYNTAIKSCHRTNPTGWLYKLLHNRAVEVHDKETCIRGRTRKENKPKHFVSIDQAATSCVISPQCVEPVMADFLINPETVFKVIEMKNCNDSKNGPLVVRASLDDRSLRDAQLRRAARHCFECSLCLDIYVYFRTGRITDTDLQEDLEWTSRNFTGAELLLFARALEEGCLPEEFYEMEYSEFLQARRVLMAKVVRETFESL
jgi:hypothetical protein